MMHTALVYNAPCMPSYTMQVDAGLHNHAYILMAFNSGCSSPLQVATLQKWAFQHYLQLTFMPKLPDKTIVLVQLQWWCTRQQG